MFGVWTDIETVLKLGSSYDTTCIFREERILMKRGQDWPTKQIQGIVTKNMILIILLVVIYTIIHYWAWSGSTNLAETFGPTLCPRMPRKLLVPNPSGLPPRLTDPAQTLHACRE